MAGGAFSPFGDITTLMVWQKGIIAFDEFFGLLVPSLVNWLVPAAIMTVAIPYMINPAEANMQGKLGFFFGGLAGVCLIWAFFRVPETKGRTYEELDLLFDKGVPARKFKKFQLEGAISSAGDNQTEGLTKRHSGGWA